MGPSDLLRSALRALRAHKLRSFLTLLGVIIGVTTIVGVVGVISGLDTYVKEKVIVLAPDVYLMSKFGIIRSREEFLEAVKRPPITFREFELLRDAGLVHTRQISAASGDAMKVNQGKHFLPAIQVIGTTANFGDMFKLDFEGGRYFTPNEDATSEAVAVIGADTRDELFPGVDPLGRTFLVRGLPFRVIGIMPRQGRSIGFNQDKRVYVPLQVYRKNFMPSTDSLEFQIQAEGGVEGVEASIDEVRSFLRAARHASYHARDPFGIITQESLQELWRQISRAAFILMFLVSSVSLGVGGVVIMNIMLVSVVERTQEIGVRMAIGARKRDIRRQFLLEALLLSLFGGLAGVLAGSAIAWIVRTVGGFPAQVGPGLVLGSVLVSTLVGLAAGFLPARRASNLPVIDALRAE